MKATVESLAAPAVAVKERPWAAVLADLVKARLTLMVLMSTLVGFYLGWQGPMNFALMFHAILGTALVAGGAAALNQLLERELDAKMHRTEDRPLPSGRMRPETVLVIGAMGAGAGLIYLALAVNLLTALLAAITLCTYVFVYTPLKRVTELNTVVGAVPGALPPLIGWVAARGEITIEGWALFAILFFWQLPHFMAIAWIYREDYARGGFAMLPVLDPAGRRTGRHALSHTLGLLPVSLFPFVFQMVGALYLFGALVLGAAFLWFAIQFSRHVTMQRARRLFYASVIYLPLLLALMLIDKVQN